MNDLPLAVDLDHRPVGMHADDGADAALLPERRPDRKRAGLPLPSYLVWAIVGSVGAATVLSFTILADYFPSEIAGQANAALNMLHIGGAFILQYAIGVILDVWGSKGGHYPTLAYQAAFSAILCLQVRTLRTIIATITTAVV